MRIGMMADVYKPHISGITNYISLNKRYLEAAGHEVFVFTFGDQDYKEDETNIIRSPGFPLVDTGYYLSFRYSRQAKALLQTMDIVHVHHPFLSGRLALRYCRPLNIPIVFTNHTRYDLYAQTYLPLLPEEISETFLETYMPAFCSAVDLVIAPSKGIAGVLRRLGVDAPIEIVPNGVEIRRFQKPCQDCRSQLGFQPDDLLLVYSGRLAPEKNLNLLLEAFIAVAEAVEHAHLLLIGAGPEEEKLRSLASQSSVADRIHFTGLLPYDELPRYLAACDIFVTASVTEVHPLSVIEAMASGLPVVGVQSVGVGDTVEDGITGFLAREDAASFAAKLTRLCLDVGLRRKMGEAARLAAEKYNIERTNKIMLSHYERLVLDGRQHQRGIRYRLTSLWEKFRR
ncbi:MAG: glycosyltransferase [Anaerolineales bacterium]|nr:glycosyltransferase [Anaerolineales bacterium]MCX7608034.1 glycosyltransferase [Anaerolineales bacterium]MDW8227500.1 glycosyltransferase [Anaerolineales bacterium]